LKKFREILGIDHAWNICIVGYGHLGNALAHYQNFFKLGFYLKAVFDQDPQKVGIPAGETAEVYLSNDLKEIIKKENIQIGIIAVLVEAGVLGIWNFAPIRLDIPDHICLISEDLAIGLSSLSYYITNKN